MTYSGLLWVNSKVTKPDEVPEEILSSWYNEEHIPQILSTGVKAAFRYKAVDPSATHPHLVLYPLETLDYMQSEKFRNLPKTSDKFPGSHDFMDYAQFIPRFYTHVQTFQPDETKVGPGKFLIAQGTTYGPNSEDEVDIYAMEQQGHLQSLVNSGRYIRTRRYKLSPLGDFGKNGPNYMAIHEYAGVAFPIEELNRIKEEEELKDESGEVQGYTLLRGFGNVELRF